MLRLASVLEVLSGLVFYFSSLSYGGIAIEDVIAYFSDEAAYVDSELKIQRLLLDFESWGFCALPGFIILALALLIHYFKRPRKSSLEYHTK